VQKTYSALVLSLCILLCSWWYGLLCWSHW